MEKKITIKINGLNNSARAINGNSINLEKLMQKKFSIKLE